MTVIWGIREDINFWLCLTLTITFMTFGIISSAVYNIGYQVDKLLIRTETIMSMLPSEIAQEMHILGFEPFNDSKKSLLGEGKYVAQEFLRKSGTCPYRDYNELEQLHSKIYIGEILSEFEKFKKRKIDKKIKKAQKKELLIA